MLFSLKIFLSSKWRWKPSNSECRSNTFKNRLKFIWSRQESIYFLKFEITFITYCHDRFDEIVKPKSIQHTKKSIKNHPIKNQYLHGVLTLLNPPPLPTTSGRNCQVNDKCKDTTFTINNLLTSLPHFSFTRRALYNIVNKIKCIYWFNYKIVIGSQRKTSNT